MTIAYQPPTFGVFKLQKSLDITSDFASFVNEWGSRGREFKSLHPDQKSLENQGFFHFSISLYFSLLLSIANIIANSVKLAAGVRVCGRKYFVL